MTPWLSVIIPARADSAALGRTLDHLQQLPGRAGVEVIVAAAGDPAGTERAVAGRARLLRPEGSTRARLMNAGAEAARGRVLFFLHADSLPPAGAFALIERVLADPRAVGGAFEHRFQEPVWSLRAISAINRARYRLTRNYYGDQGQFVRADVFRALGGYRDLALMEDLDFAQRLKRRGRSVLIGAPLVTSGRRFLARGPWRTFFFIVWLLALWTLRLDTQRYAERWRGPARETPGNPWPRERHGAGAGDLVDALVRRYARGQARDVAPWIVGRRVLDLGAGEGYVVAGLGRAVIPCAADVGPFRRARVRYLVYDGRRLPFDDATFDTTLLLLVLHHCDKAEQVLDEAIRVTRHRLLVTESVHRNRLDLFWLRLLDGRVNRLRHDGRMAAPVAFRRPEEWDTLFASRGLRPVATRWLGSRWERLIHHPRLSVLDIGVDYTSSSVRAVVSPKRPIA
ncbi:MAG TPA: TIGR04283 family arsenosugar biosynthesis glycosyltransferase [Methylomirabilota bacterium]|nr:TIGR04283 family arsenosugar biosynthesis glycosyltransferase [Methylomirabilota bacterium]